MGGRGGRYSRMQTIRTTDAGQQQGAQSSVDGTQRITDPQALYSFFEQADDAAADAMLAQWQAEPLDPDGRQYDNDSNRFFNYIGWTSNVPEVLTESEYQQALQQEALRQGGTPEQLYHSDQPYGGVGARQFATQFMGQGYAFNGQQYRQYVSQGIHGDGTYFAPSANDSASYGTSQFRGFLNANARIADESTLRNEFRSFEQKHPSFSRVLDRMSGGYGGQGDRNGLLSVFAAMKGYNAIRATYHNGYVTLLDRKALTMSSKTQKTKRGMSNW